MAKASLNFANGTMVTIEGSKEEVSFLLGVYQVPPESKRKLESISNIQNNESGISKTKLKGSQVSEDIDLILTIVNKTKDCENAENIENNIFDRSSQINKILLPLYVSYKYFGNKYSLTSGEISKITAKLGIPLNISNVSNALSGSAARYVMGNKTKKTGGGLRYNLTHRGLKYMKEIIENVQNDK